MNITNLAKFLPVVLAIAGYLFGVGDVPFSDLASFQKFIATNFPQLGGLAVVAGGIGWYVLQQLKNGRLKPAELQAALADGKLDLADIIGAVDMTHGPEMGTYVKSALADGAIVTLRHACNHSKPLTEQLSEFAKAYYVDQVDSLEPTPA